MNRSMSFEVCQGLKDLVNNRKGGGMAYRAANVSLRRSGSAKKEWLG